jgi:hypothetical protein
MESGVMIFTCEKCFKPFERATKQRVYRFCSHYCANKHALKLGRDELLAYAEIGARVAHIAKRLEVSEHTVRDALKRNGLFKLWYSVRYNRNVAVAA